MNATPSKGDVLLEEYRQIRSEINEKQGYSHKVMNLSFLVLVGSLGAYGAVSEELKQYLLLVAPLITGLLGLVFAYEVSHIVIASGYIHRDLRPRLESAVATGTDEILRWEIYKKANSSRLGVIFDGARWLAFALPAILFIPGYFFLGSLRVDGEFLLIVGNGMINGLVLLFGVHRVVFKRIKLWGGKSSLVHGIKRRKMD